MKKINIYQAVSFISFYTILLYILFLKWAYNASVTPIVCASSILLLILSITKKTNYLNDKFKFKFIASILVFMLYVIINLLFTNEHEYFINNIVSATLFPLISSFYFVQLLNNEKKFLKKYIINPSFIVLNIYYTINFFIILKQVSTPGFMIHNYTTNTFYLDHIAGLIGANGTAKLMLLNIICLNINLAQFSSQNMKISKISKIMFILILVGSCYVSLLNDSRMYYLLLILFMFPTLIVYLKNNISIHKLYTKTLKKIGLLVLIILGLYTVYLCNNSIKTLVNDKFIKNYYNRTVQNIGESGNEERIELFKLAIKEGNGLKFGKGIGTLPANGEGYVRHFGLNDFNVRVYSGGIVYIVLLLFIYMNIYEILLKIKPNEHHKKIYYFAILIIIGLYMQVYTYCDKNILLSLIFMTTSYAQIKKKNG